MSTGAPSISTLPTVPLNSIGQELAVIAILASIVLVGLFVTRSGVKKYRTANLITNTPPEKVRSVAVGRTELHGHARDAGVVFDRPFTAGKCLYYSYSVREQREVEKRDEDGNKKKEKEWNTISSHSLAAPFYLEDDTGKILVLANAGANFVISDDSKWSKTYRGRAPSGLASGFDTSPNIASAMPDNIDAEDPGLLTRIQHKIPGVGAEPDGLQANLSGSPKKPKTRSSGGRGRLLKTKVSETVLPVDAETYVYGGARIRNTDAGSNAERLFIASDEGSGKFVISDKSEGDVAKKFRRWGIIYTVLGLAIVLVMLVFITSGM